jgi:hypothetical protein
VKETVNILTEKKIVIIEFVFLMLVNIEFFYAKMYKISVMLINN